MSANQWGIDTRPTIDPELLAEFNRGTSKARRAYREQPNAVTREVLKSPGYAERHRIARRVKR